MTAALEQSPAGPRSLRCSGRPAIPLYFFHLRCHGRAVEDSTGASLRDPDQAWEAARAIARELMEGKAEAQAELLSCHFEVTDGTGEIVFEFPFTEAVKPTGEPH